jgi:4-hydroxymandelate oxidase
MISLADIEKAAASVLDPAIWDFVTGGSGDEQTLRANRAALDAVAVVPRVLSGVGGASAATVLVASPSEFPAAVAPMAYQRLVHPDGEVALAQAAYSAGIPYVVSTLSSSPVEEIAATGAELWFQLYWLRDRDVVRNLMRRAEQAGCRALIVTVDVPVMGRRRRDIRNSFALPPSISASHLPAEHTAGAQLTDAKTSALAAHTQSIFDPAFGWEDLAWLAERTSLPVVIKGILDPDDARRAARMGVAAVVVSNHGGRQFDGAPPSITALAAIVEAVAGSCQVLLDSGIRSGKDMLRALACGADGVLIGRPLLWGLAADGAAGAYQVLDLLRAEFTESLILAGCADVHAARGLRTITRIGW